MVARHDLHRLARAGPGKFQAHAARLGARRFGQPQAFMAPHRLGPPVTSSVFHVPSSIQRPPQPYSTKKSEGVAA